MTLKGKCIYCGRLIEFEKGQNPGSCDECAPRREQEIQEMRTKVEFYKRKEAEEKAKGGKGF